MAEANNYNKFRKRSTLTSASDILQGLLHNSKTPLSDQFLRWKLWQQWVDVVDAEMARQTRPVGFDRGTLLIWVEHSVYIQQLNFVTKELTEKVNKYVGRDWVKRIRFTLDRKVVLSEEEQRKQLDRLLGQP
ncbi:MAG: hypothetical protein A4S09_00170 [Proteobacteria bacterium SG_bin7]|nr:MAG: hypothetical protein A4S09_00170 [Proteobacteria bacterium SG_bin7]